MRGVPRVVGGARAQGVRMRARGQRSGAGLRGEGAAAVLVSVSFSSWRGRCVVARVVVGKYPGWAVWRRHDPAARCGGSRGAGTGGRFLAAPGVGAGGARREAGQCPCRLGDEGRLAPVPRQAPRGPVPASAALAPRARVYADAPAGRGQAQVL